MDRLAAIYSLLFSSTCAICYTVQALGLGEAGRKRLSLMGDPGVQISITPDWHFLQALGLVLIEPQKKQSV